MHIPDSHYQPSRSLNPKTKTDPDSNNTIQLLEPVSLLKVCADEKVVTEIDCQNASMDDNHDEVDREGRDDLLTQEGMVMGQPDEYFVNRAGDD